MKLEIGCGENKKEGYFGMDIHQYDGVDLVQDVSDAPWKIDDESCTEIYANQVVEHIPNLALLFSEMYRVAKNGCAIRLTTPHYSSHNSWADPTHIHHLSVDFCRPLTEGYLTKQLPGFQVTNKKITFGGFLWTWPGQLICLLFGYRFYEKHFTWMFPASSIIVDLVVNK